MVWRGATAAAWRGTIRSPYRWVQQDASEPVNKKIIGDCWLLNSCHVSQLKTVVNLKKKSGTHFALHTIILKFYFELILGWFQPVLLDMSSTYNVESESDDDDDEEIEIAPPVPKNSTWHLHDIEKVHEVVWMFRTKVTRHL